MLATRPRLAWYVATAVVLVGLLALIEVRSIEKLEAGNELASRERTPSEERKSTRKCTLGSHYLRSSPDTLRVVLHEAPEVTGVEIESDWAKTYRMVWDGPIRSWTTMRHVRVPSLDHRMIESIEPIDVTPANAEDTGKVLRIKVRVVVPGDRNAALAWVAANPAVKAATVEKVFAY